MKKLAFLIFSAFMLLGNQSSGHNISKADTGERTYILSRGPQTSAVSLTRQWLPFLKRIKDDTGIQIKLKVYTSCEQFEGDLFGAHPDFAFTNPYFAMLVKEKHGYIPLVRDDSRLLRGVFVVRKDSNINSLQDLNGKIIAFPYPNSMTASLYPRAILHEKFLLEFRPIYVGTHENVYRAVTIGKAIAGVGMMQTLSSEPEELREQLKILYTTPGVRPHPLIVHPRVNQKVQEKVTQAILNMAHDKQGQRLLKAVKLTVPVIVDSNRDYNNINKLGLEKYLKHWDQ
ncbi:MAG: phosphate/phosphite/phosphonate ABC transporter substrate-binding protein [Gammaproteobacteria bacterium]|nr:MAG: phosphate/phosphite/phosphonate ABC transporter substrate-binding protein [Gammaproteobacteria bacterium]